MIKAMFSLSVLLSFACLAGIPADFTAHLRSSGKVQIPTRECKEMEEKVGQLLYINVDGFGSRYTIDPAYDRLVKRIQPGGVLPHYNSANPDRVRSANRTLQNMSDLPLMIGVDYVYLNNGPDQKSRAGLGYGAGISGELNDVDITCYERVAAVDAALHKYLGINNPLGPTIENTTHFGGILDREVSYKAPRLGGVVDQFRKMGLETTIKHFPYTPSNFNLHDDSPDTNIDEETVDRDYMPIFKELAGQSGMLMTTHLYNSQVDSNNMATFSKAWMKKLREEVGFNGLVMTDALFMISSYSGVMRQMASDWPAQSSSELNDDFSIFAIKAILAGHDMVFLESSATVTERIWKNLVTFSCQEGGVAEDFRKRVRESFSRIQNYKQNNPELEDEMAPLEQSELNELIRLRDNPELLCAMNESDVSPLLEKFYSEETAIGDDIFACMEIEDDSFEALFSNLINDVSQTIPPEDLFMSFQDAMGSELSGLLGLINETEERRDSVVEHAKLKLNSSNLDEVARAFDVLKKLGAWDDSTYVDHLIETRSLDKLKLYLGMAKHGGFPFPSKDKRITAFQLIRSLPRADRINMLSAIFPPPSGSELSVREIMNSSLSIKDKAYILLRTQAPINVSNLSESEAFDFISTLEKEASYDNFIPTEYVAEERTNGSKRYDQGQVSTFNLISAIANDYNFTTQSAQKIQTVWEMRSRAKKRGMNPMNYDVLILKIGRRPSDLTKLIQERVTVPDIPLGEDYVFDQYFQFANSENISLEANTLLLVKEELKPIARNPESYLGYGISDYIRSHPDLFPESDFDRYRNESE